MFYEKDEQKQEKIEKEFSLNSLLSAFAMIISLSLSISMYIYISLSVTNSILKDSQIYARAQAYWAKTKRTEYFRNKYVCNKDISIITMQEWIRALDRVWPQILSHLTSFSMQSIHRSFAVTAAGFDSLRLTSNLPCA